MKSYRYKVVDVFTTEVLKGNALAVFPDASDLDATTMQKIAREFNLTETVFVLPTTRQDCAAALRIFTPAKELPFAGHPTVGGAFVLLEEGIVPKDSSAFVVEELVVVERDGNLFGDPVNRCARIRGLGSGGQTLLSAPMFELMARICVGVSMSLRWVSCTVMPAIW